MLRKSIILVFFGVITLLFLAGCSEASQTERVYVSNYKNKGVSISETIANDQKTILKANGQYDIVLNDNSVSQGIINGVKYYFITIQEATTKKNIKVPSGKTQITYSDTSQAIFQSTYVKSSDNSDSGYTYKLTLPKQYNIKDMGDTLKDNQDDDFILYLFPILMSSNNVTNPSSSSSSTKASSKGSISASNSSEKNASITEEDEETQQTQTTVEEEEVPSSSTSTIDEEGNNNSSTMTEEDDTTTTTEMEDDAVTAVDDE